MEVRQAGPDLTIGQMCTYIDMGADNRWIIDAEGQYPSRWPRSLNDIAEMNPPGAFMLLMMADNPKKYTYRPAKVIAHAGDSVLTVLCWDGLIRTLPTEYMEQPTPANLFAVGDPVLCYQKYPNEWIIIGKPGTLEETLQATIRYTQVDVSESGGSTTTYQDYFISWAWTNGIGGGTLDIPFSLAFDSGGSPAHTKTVEIIGISPIPTLDLDSVSFYHPPVPPFNMIAHHCYLTALNIVCTSGIKRFRIEFSYYPPDYPGYNQLWRITAEV